MQEVPVVYQKGMLEITPKEQLLTPDLSCCDVGVQIAKDGRIWLCVNGQVLSRFKPLKPVYITKNGYGNCPDCIWYDEDSGCNVERDSPTCQLNKKVKDNINV